MNRDEYLKNRAALLDEAQDKLDSGDIEASAAKQEEVTALDKKYQMEAKAQESLSALSEIPRVGSQFETNMQNATAAPGAEVDMDEVTNSRDYRKAFMNNVLKGTPMPARFRNADANTLTTDISTAIPTVVVDRIVEKMESIGMILPLVTRTSYASGVNIPTSTVKPVAKYFDVSLDYLLDFERSEITNTQTEKELLRIFRTLTPEQQELYIEQGKTFVRINQKRYLSQR